ncbi:MAG: pseudaminic acid synthase [Gammaproteobacteria bacterium]|nr:pseudaminic acid synthase [Gammaproteobacteria bacterium]HBF08132.1 pseudaminic acid synthase [Gammaproteobacteria bacterium]|tara:strand:+ start:9144 stop:10187 length:1044 start_codon:yes stop_codon:yes gene_type:complete
MFKIGNVELGSHCKPFIIAELSANHNGSLDKAKQLIAAAASAGVSAVKIQTYTADSMTLDTDMPGFKIEGGLWDGYSLYDLYQEASTPYEWHQALFDYAAQLGVILFSSPFDENAVDFLDSLYAPAFKVASFEMVDLPLIRYIASKKKPILISTGMSNESEIGEALEVARQSGARDILLFHCVSGYPTPLEESKLSNIQFLKKHFNVEVGLSDHTLGHSAAIASIALGAVAIEKHFTLDRNDKGPDSEFSLEPVEFKALVDESFGIWTALQYSHELKRSVVEKQNKQFRRSIYFVEDLAEGAEITKTAIRRIRPGYGLAPKYFDELIGRKVSKAVKRGEPVSWDVLK